MNGENRTLSVVVLDGDKPTELHPWASKTRDVESVLNSVVQQKPRGVDESLLELFCVSLQPLVCPPANLLDSREPVQAIVAVVVDARAVDGVDKKLRTLCIRLRKTSNTAYETFGFHIWVLGDEMDNDVLVAELRQVAEGTLQDSAEVKCFAVGRERRLAQRVQDFLGECYWRLCTERAVSPHE